MSSLRPDQHAALAVLGELSAHHPELGPYLTRELALRARSYMKGVEAYRQHPVRRSDEEMPIIWQSGSACVRDYTSHAARGAPVILAVPSLINRFTILDLQPRHSLLRMLSACGFRVHVIDWGEPTEGERRFALADYVTRTLTSALDHIDAPPRGVHLLGYCMGGLLALGAAVLRPDKVRTLSLLATPWDFHAGYDEALRRIETQILPWTSSGDPVPCEVIQGLFSALQPMQSFHKFSAFAAQDMSSMKAERFVLTEDWLNDGVALTAPAARDCFGAFCARNVAANGLWFVGGQNIIPQHVAAPSYLVIPARDRIVPPESAQVLCTSLPHGEVLEPDLGHIGIMASERAPRDVWRPLAEWLARH